VVGGGVIGLSTAVELLQRNVSVVLEAPRHPLHPATCSMGAGGLWMPFHVEDERVTRWSKETLDALLPLAAGNADGTDKQDDGDDNNQQSDDPPLVEIVPTVMLLQNHTGPVVEDFATAQYKKVRGENTATPKLPSWSADPRIQFQHMTVEMLSWQNISYRLRIPPEQELKEAGYLHAWLFRPPVVNSTLMLVHLLQQIQDSPNAQVNVETGHEYESVQEMRERASNLGCDTVVNCTGLGAAEICNDTEMVGARGILLQFERASCVRRLAVRESPYGENVNDAIILAEEGPWGSETAPAYMIPRADTVVVGGSYLEGDAELLIRDEERERLLLNAERLGIDTQVSKPKGEWVGFRPFRSKVRCEMDDEFVNTDVKVFHSYGYGGSGWTVNVGAARECANILLLKS